MYNMVYKSKPKAKTYQLDAVAALNVPKFLLWGITTYNKVKNKNVLLDLFNKTWPNVPTQHWDLILKAEAEFNKREDAVLVTVAE